MEISTTVTLEVKTGFMAGKRFEFDEHDTFVFGRASVCHIQMPREDDTVSRHHFILEVNPPDAVLRDLGSLNGTWVNGVKHGGRSESESPEEAVRRQYPEVKLKNGDRIQVGGATMLVKVKLPANCCECEQPIADKDRERCAWIGGTFLCPSCKEKLIVSASPAKNPNPVRCRKCGKDVTREVGAGRRGAYVCESCRKKANGNPVALMDALPRKNKRPEAIGADVIDGYELERKLGEGAYGAVYQARRKRDGQSVAIKVMLARIAVDARTREKFVREAGVMMNFRHPNIVSLLGYSSAGSAFYFIMELCNGGSVADQMARQGGKLSLARAEPIMRQCLDGLSHAHGKGYVHRDLKPQNLLLTKTRASEIAKIGDLGMAKNFQLAGLSGMTLTGEFGGTPGFMPREVVIHFKRAKPVSDVWSLGATFYCMLTGRTPCDFPRGIDPVKIVLDGKVVPIRKRDSKLPKKLAAVIDQSLAVNPKDRFQDAREFQRALERAL